MLEVAITSIKCALRDEFPEFCEFYEEIMKKQNGKETTDSEDANQNSDSEAEENSSEAKGE